MQEKMQLKIISAGAGSGKTYTLTQQMAELLIPKDGQPAEVRASGILATTFTNKAAAELKERVRVKLLEEGMSQEADELGQAMIGTVHAVGVQLLKRFAFEAGLSPEMDIIAEGEQSQIFNQSLSTILTEERSLQMEMLSKRLGYEEQGFYGRDWRSDILQLTDLARSNNLDAAALEESATASVRSLLALLPSRSAKTAAALDQQLRSYLENTLAAVLEIEDGTKSRQTLISKLRSFQNKLRARGYLHWSEWVALGKACGKAPKKCKEAVEELKELTDGHESHPQFQEDLSQYIEQLFSLAQAAIDEYETYKTSRGLIDYTDMEVYILKLLEQPLVREVLEEELDLLLVDEFQDTNPIQLKIFLDLSRLAKRSIWVGDPKQSIYGFRGAAPELMQAVVEQASEMQVLGNSWRSRQDLVHFTNGLFCKAFPDLGEERVALEVAPPFKKELEPQGLGHALEHWVIDFKEGKRRPGKPWPHRALAHAIAQLLKEGRMIRPRGKGQMRPLEAGDIAVLCRSNQTCQDLAEQLAEEGLKASIARKGLLKTPEASLLHACLKFILNPQDSLSVAELKLLLEAQSLEEIVKDRLKYLEREQEQKKYKLWGESGQIKRLLHLAQQLPEMSATEIVNLVIEKMNLRNVVARWGNANQRFANLDALRSKALEYEENCNRLHNAATLGGFLLWLDHLEREGLDAQASSQSQDAVNVLTYHKSKGLEWPFVVCYELEKSLRENYFGFQLISTQEEVDLKNPLANRLISFWPNPYGKQSQKTNLVENIKALPQTALRKKAQLQEESRLLYVGVTRARDYLALPIFLQQKNWGLNWLNRSFHLGDEEMQTVDPDSDFCIWDWKGNALPVQRMQLELFKEIDPLELEREEEVFPYLQAFKGEQDHLAAQPETAEQLMGEIEMPIFGEYPYVPGLPIEDISEEEEERLGQLLQLYLRADQLDYALSLREQTAQQLLEDFELKHQLNSLQLMRLSQQFHQSLRAFGPMQLHRARRFRFQQDRQVFRGQVDYYFFSEEEERQILMLDVLYTYEGWKQKSHRIREAAAKLYAAKNALAQAGYSASCYLHFPLSGLYVEVAPSLVGEEEEPF
ncbi:UvrD-helicase domain-containing protein [Saprospira grandis]|uniref:DNA 3'-5' helicase n=1 Tax=Saprospira grandis (strain Lewin) TaxID=984262 RepID=H6L102_SAPGL|nr:UvrD-helicase domain-containing protein [Saprospira grandis]AFC25958.1 UvrD/REP helicase [Saprospira grandis str. Lewin]